MPSREIHAYLVAREAHAAAMSRWPEDRVVVGRLLDERMTAWAALGVSKSPWDPIPADTATAIDFSTPTAAEDEHVFLPLLVVEYHGDALAAGIAWGLGQRPAGYAGSEVDRG